MPRRSYELAERQGGKFPSWLGNPRKNGKIFVEKFVNRDCFGDLLFLEESPRTRISLAKFGPHDRFYVLKGIKKSWIRRNSKNADLVENEMRIHIGLHHRFIINLFRIFDHHSFVYLVQEYAVGSTLELLAQSKKGRLGLPVVFSLDAARFYVAEIASALNYLHEKQHVIHRNIDFESVGIAWDGHVKLLGFGRAVQVYPKCPLIPTEVDDVTRMSTAAPELIPPFLRSFFMDEEEAESACYSFEVDWWALGVLLFQLVFGHLPFGDCRVDTNEEITRSILNGERRRKRLWTNILERQYFKTGVLELLDGLFKQQQEKRWVLNDLKESKFFEKFADWSMLHHIAAPHPPRWALVEADMSMFAAPRKEHKKKMSKPGVFPEELQLRPKKADIENGYFVHICANVMEEAISHHNIRDRNAWASAQKKDKVDFLKNRRELRQSRSVSQVDGAGLT